MQSISRACRRLGGRGKLFHRVEQPTRELYNNRRCYISWTRATTQQAPSADPVQLFSCFSMFSGTVHVFEFPEQYTADPEMAGTRGLYLGTTGGFHSVYRPGAATTNCYWDALACLPALCPEGPLALLGLGAGTVPRVIQHHFLGSNARVVHGWELDPAVIMVGRMYLSMQELEDSGQLVTHTADALSVNAEVSKLPVFSGVVVDLFSNGQILPELTQVATWSAIAQLASVSGSRVMANLGYAPPSDLPQAMWPPDAHTTASALAAMQQALGPLSVLTACGDDVTLLRANTLALSGPLPTAEEWQGSLPDGLQHLAKSLKWMPYAYLQP